MKDDNIIFGRNPVIELLNARHSINKILIADRSKDGSVKKIIALAIDHKIRVEFVPRAKLDQLSSRQNHQGVIALAAPVEYSSLDDILEHARDGNQPPFIILLDEIQDPHNFGAILRTADAAGVHGVLIPKHRSVSLSATVAKTSAGAVEYVRIAQIGNVAQTLRQLKELDLTILGADLDGQSIFKPSAPIDLTVPIVIAIGNEGKGLRRLTKDLCDRLIAIPMVGNINSLNASCAAAVLIYEVVRQRISL